jgi:hypothetical protein
MQPATSLDDVPFQRPKPQHLVPGILDPSAGPGLHCVPTTSPLHRYCRALCQSGGAFRDGTTTPIAGFRLVSVQAVVRDSIAYTCYEGRQMQITSRRQGGSTCFNFATRDFSAQQLHVLSALREQFQERPPGMGARAVNTLYAFHGPRGENVESVCMNGLTAVRALDAGYFGSGCYLSLNIEYALRYAHGEFDVPAYSRPRPADGRYPVIMFAVSVGMAYPVTPDVDYSSGSHQSDFFGRPLKPGFDTHVICVNENMGFQAVSRQECQYVEIVIDQEMQMLPIAVLWFEEN